MHMMATVARLPSIASRFGGCHGACRQEGAKVMQTVDFTHQRCPLASIQNLTSAKRAHRLTAGWRRKACGCRAAHLASHNLHLQTGQAKQTAAFVVIWVA